MHRRLTEYPRSKRTRGKHVAQSHYPTAQSTRPGHSGQRPIGL